MFIVFVVPFFMASATQQNAFSKLHQNFWPGSQQLSAGQAKFFSLSIDVMKLQTTKVRIITAKLATGISHEDKSPSNRPFVRLHFMVTFLSRML